MATYFFTTAFQTTDPVSEDGTHLEAQYGFAVASGGGSVSAIGSSGGSGRTFETVRIPAATNNQTNQLVISLCSDLIGINQSLSFARVSFRPAHDVQPANNLPLAPLTPNNAQTLLTGIALTTQGTSTTERVNITNGTAYGLPQNSYATQWLFAAMPFLSGQQPGTSLHFEFTIEIAINVGTNWTYYKVDPEMQVDF
jgi:hypothetical protein